ncbi:Putative short-chain dehydrogenase/reductase SDR, NAD(P)-binding domain superfamily [Septoria linicola]|uniref:Short-chain dehydrogenase/reductase SDR, NAD(P)-binding domain superfamily n=1 Tax=Septoria linicola TaxID=215465 RepID=A0A9Q9EM81_9PEZI|nr:putative short-chain dehydrogenase/reductase SDR, NAD(P)-binding domain superfamily [Septoria linicola]USW56551.1 Putative short-chain dehydrogenase/reductase SDR, NAD(P)-binding domain superfamily [Septoria linicola]
MTSKTILITGANRGLGRGLTTAYLAQPNTHIIATVRNPSDSTSSSLTSLRKAQGSSLTLLQLDVAKETDYPTLVQSLSSLNITNLDTVIANAAIAQALALAKDVKPADLLSHIQVNVIGPLLLFQHLLPFLTNNNSNSSGKFIAMSSSAGSIGGQEALPVPTSVYGTSKAALNYIVRKMHFENEGLVVLAMEPGWVQTEMGKKGAVELGFGDRINELLITTEVSVEGMVKVIEGATREETGGRFVRYNGEQMPW